VAHDLVDQHPADAGREYDRVFARLEWFGQYSLLYPSGDLGGEPFDARVRHAPEIGIEHHLSHRTAYRPVLPQIRLQPQPTPPTPVRDDPSVGPHLDSLFEPDPSGPNLGPIVRLIYRTNDLFDQPGGLFHGQPTTGPGRCRPWIPDPGGGKQPLGVRYLGIGLESEAALARRSVSRQPTGPTVLNVGRPLPAIQLDRDILPLFEEQEQPVRTAGESISENRAPDRLAAALGSTQCFETFRLAHLKGFRSAFMFVVVLFSGERHIAE
jgi:hypothetical protein